MTFHEALQVAINGWKSNPITDEWLFANFRDKFVERLSTGEAFNSIDQSIDVLLSETDESTAIEILQTIIALARRSNTTQLPNSLLVKKIEIQNHFSHFDEYAYEKLLELFNYYRL